VRACVRVCVRACVCVCVCVCMCMCMCMYAYVYVYIFVCKYTYMYKYAYTHRETDLLSFARTHTRNHACCCTRKSTLCIITLNVWETWQGSSNCVAECAVQSAAVCCRLLQSVAVCCSLLHYFVEGSLIWGEQRQLCCSAVLCIAV